MVLENLALLSDEKARLLLRSARLSRLLSGSLPAKERHDYKAEYDQIADRVTEINKQLFAR